eukprot:CAMPEP_0176439272 /NCGR_PEP_ID=MMETSP0127-20121128/19840_1 /TAXON_ID=938130 /ORGANISM="Platyophrya macrostoma, Strain WH" /LENGTH=245 /DNA_ID=CAMNT_0017823501 /DNA_START=28 /DNA_END=765 /DNA_ORIENTATION=+
MNEQYDENMLQDDCDSEGTPKKVAKFIERTFSFLKDKKYAETVTWNRDGSIFIVKKIKEFADEVLWHFFGHRNLSSFTRQMNLYGFERCASEVDQCAFTHPLFKRSSSFSELAMIRRKKRCSKRRFEFSSTYNHAAFRLAAQEKSVKLWQIEKEPFGQNKIISQSYYQEGETHNLVQQLNESQPRELINSYYSESLQAEYFSVGAFIEELRAMRERLQRENEQEDLEPALMIRNLLIKQQMEDQN